MSRLPSLQRWRKRPARALVPPGLYPWLTDAGSLTARIRARSTRFEVEVLSQRIALPHRDEAAALRLRAGELAWLREVLLRADGRPVVYARSLLPRRNRSGACRIFHGIGSQPLGAALFADPRIERGPLVSTALDARDARYHRAAAVLAGREAPRRLWARRSVFRMRHRPLLVTEIFLPAVLDLRA